MHEVFVDSSGRRRRLARYAGIGVGCLLAAYLAVVASGLFTGSGSPLTPWPGASHRPRAARGDTPSRRPPSRPPSPGPTASPSPRVARSAARTASPSPTVHGRGHGRGLTKGPNPRKPSG